MILPASCNRFSRTFLQEKRFSSSPNERLTRRLPHSAECVKGLCPFETHHLLEKVDENFCLLSALWFSCKQKIPVFQTVFCRKTGTRAFSCGATQIGFIKPTLKIRNKVPNLLCCDNGAGSVDAYLKSKFVRAALISPFKTATDTALSPAAAL